MGGMKDGRDERWEGEGMDGRWMRDVWMDGGCLDGWGMFGWMGEGGHVSYYIVVYFSVYHPILFCCIYIVLFSLFYTQKETFLLS